MGAFWLFLKYLGMTTKVHNMHSSITTGYYAWFKTALGPVLIGATSKGLCKLGWEKDRRMGLAFLRAKHPDLQWVERKAPLARPAKALDNFLKGHAKKFNPPLDLQGTPFQRSVWKALQRVPSGRNITYKKLAAAAGHPRAIRAVANACAQNTVAVAVPCHRAIHTNASPAGYRWGIGRKKRILALERYFMKRSFMKYAG